MLNSEWSEEAYSRSLTSRCWWFTPYDDGWGAGVQADEEVRAILAMEQALGELPAWVEQVVREDIHSVAPCGHYTFPLSFLDAVEAIGAEASRPLHHTCYTVERTRKERMQDYALCLDAWLAGASPEQVAPELAARERGNTDWPTLCQDLWQVLGVRTELKELLVTRLLHHTRWWLKATVWEDDLGDQFGRDEYLGDFRPEGTWATQNGNPRLRAPEFVQTASPRVQQLEARLAEVCPHWDWFRPVMLEWSWPCAPKAFRYLEKLLWSIGQERPAVSLPDISLERPDTVPGFLQCEDSWPDPEAANAWWRAFLAALRGWWQDRPETGEVAEEVARRLGEPTPVKRWLVRLLVRRLELLEQHAGNFDRLFAPAEGAQRGRGTLWR